MKTTVSHFFNYRIPKAIIAFGTQLFVFSTTVQTALTVRTVKPAVSVVVVS